MYEGVTVKRITFNNLSVYLLLLVGRGSQIKDKFCGKCKISSMLAALYTCFSKAV